MCRKTAQDEACLVEDDSAGIIDGVFAETVSRRFMRFSGSLEYAVGKFSVIQYHEIVIRNPAIYDGLFGSPQNQWQMP